MKRELLPLRKVLIIISGFSGFIAITAIVLWAAQPLFMHRHGVYRIPKKVKMISQNYMCPCGSCSDMPLDICDCGTAKTIHYFIEEKLESQNTTEHVIAAVDSLISNYNFYQH